MVVTRASRRKSQQAATGSIDTTAVATPVKQASPAPPATPAKPKRTRRARNPKVTPAKRKSGSVVVEVEVESKRIKEATPVDIASTHTAADPSRIEPDPSHIDAGPTHTGSDANHTDADSDQTDADPVAVAADNAFEDNALGDNEESEYEPSDDEMPRAAVARARVSRRRTRGGRRNPTPDEPLVVEVDLAPAAPLATGVVVLPAVDANRPLLTTVQKMPAAGDMRLVLSPDVYQRIVPAASAAAAAAAAPGEWRKAKMPRRKKGGEKSRKEHLEGEVTDDEGSGDVDPRDLPMDDIDYSRYGRLFQNHPHLKHAWSGLAEPRTPVRIAQPAALKIRLLPFQQEGVQWMSEQEHTQFRGGILADEMGMGKTLQTIALLLVNGGGPTLVVCPTVALLQWKAEIELATDALSVLVYYGDDRKRLGGGGDGDGDGGTVNEAELAKYDVVLTTYGVLETAQRREKSGFRRKGRLLFEASVLHAIGWHRVVLDEAHHLKDRWSNTSRAAFALRTEHTWSLTGTPLHNRVGELYALIRLTKADPFCMYFCHSCECASLQWQFRQSKFCHGCGCKHTVHFSYWNMHIQKAIQDHGVRSPESQMGFKKLGRLLDNVMLRRTKVERAEDMGLPPRVVVTRRDRFAPEEEDLYMSLFSDYQREFDTYAMHGTVLNNYANIFELITRMRLAANHPDLLRLKLGVKDRMGSDGRDTLVCALCNEEAEDAIVARCKHVFCRVDAQQYVGGAADVADLRCPVCFALFEVDLTQPELKAPRARAAAGAQATLMESMLTTPRTTEYRRSIVNRIDMRTWRSSTKIEALVEELSRLRQGDASVKSIVFSQFVNFLDLIQWRLNRAGFSVCRLDGRMTPTQRDAVIRTFMTRAEYTVFLVSLKAGGVALNLTEASHVFLADCWWNPSVEVQAMDRIHRMGQFRPVKVTRIVIDNSIESRIIALQVKKQLLVSSTIGRDKKSLDSLSEQDMEFLFSS
ncbi:DNA repair protein rad16 [Coemansia sp. RSA 2711]|nr:DNA repair protein rad16 [Coemansia sp. RSA 2711]